MLQIVNGGLGPRVFGQVEPKISRVLQALATYVEAETSRTVMILRPSTKPANMGSDRPLSLRPNGAELPLFLVNCSSGGAAFECSVSGIAREELVGRDRQPLERLRVQRAIQEGSRHDPILAVGPRRREGRP